MNHTVELSCCSIHDCISDIKLWMTLNKLKPNDKKSFQRGKPECTLHCLSLFW